MRGSPIFFSFFILFMLASLAVPVPLFPGNMVPTWLGVSTSNYASLFSALVNGGTYGFLVWAVFVVATRGLDESGVASYERKKNQQNNKRRTAKH